jgi:uncharacterized membrane protein YoaK (UPF0700 family)
VPVQQQEAKSESHAVSLLLLHWNAGMLDGFSYLHAHVFTANMTGNFVLLGIHGIQGNLAAAIREMEAIAAFGLGAFAAALLIGKREDRGENVMPLSFAAEFCLLAVVAMLFFIRSGMDTHFVNHALIIAAAMALAVQSVAVRHLRISGVVSTFISGTITTSMVGIARVLRKIRSPEKRSEEQHTGLLLGMLSVYFGGVVFATLLNSRVPWVPATAPAIILAFVFWRSRRRGST